MNPERTHYQVIGVDPDATFEAIRSAYRTRAQRLHPDSSGGAHTQSEFAVLAAAYAVLSDPVKRRAYDAGLESLNGVLPRGNSTATHRPHFTWTNIAADPAPDPERGGRSSTDFDEMFDAFFGSDGAGSR